MAKAPKYGLGKHIYVLSAEDVQNYLRVCLSLSHTHTLSLTTSRRQSDNARLTNVH